MQRTSNILNSIYLYYRQFADNVRSTFAEERLAIEKDIQGLIKLATWRDINVYALQQSAQKTHKQLYKRIRKFRELLRQPVLNHLRISQTATSISSISSEASGVAWDHDFGKFTQGNASSRSHKFGSVLSNSVTRILDPSSSSAIEELSQTVISAQEGYAKSAPPRDLTSDQRKRWFSALLVRKKRAWNDFLKEMKRIGLSPNVKPETIARHRSRRCIFEQHPLQLLANHSLQTKLEKINKYYYRSITVMNDLQCDRNHHPDVTTRELQRGVSSFESAFSIATSARARQVFAAH